MKLRGYFYILTLLLLAIFGFVFYESLKVLSWKSAVVAALVLVTLAFLVLFYQKVVRPMQSISSGMDLLREQDFSSRLRSVGQHEADKVVAIFNKMMEQLKNERLRLREQNQFLDLLIKASPMGVMVLDFDGRVTELNPAAFKIMGVSHLDEVKGKQLSELKETLQIDLTDIPANEGDEVEIFGNNITIDEMADKLQTIPYEILTSVSRRVKRV